MSEEATSPEEEPPTIDIEPTLPASDSDSDRNAATPERAQWEYHDKSWWRGCWRQHELEAAWKSWNRRGSLKKETFTLEYKGVRYIYNFKKFQQFAEVLNEDGTVKAARKTRSIRRILVTHERDTKKPYDGA